MLTINREYFRLRKPLERRLYELARKHCGQQAAWAISLAHLRDKCGALSPLKNFRFQIRDIIHPTKEQEHAVTHPSPHFPDYQMTLDAPSDLVTFRSRKQLILESLQAYDIPPSPLSVREKLSHTTALKGARLVEEAGTGWDYGVLVDQFNEALARGFVPRHLNAAFLGFVRTKVTQSP